MTPSERDAFDKAYVEVNFQYDHLPPGPLQEVSAEHRILADKYMHILPPNIMRTKALDYLLLAKDAAVRAHLKGQP